MSCKYIALYSRPVDEEPYTSMCACPCPGDYCDEHQKKIDVVNELDRELQEIIRERKRDPK